MEYFVRMNHRENALDEGATANTRHGRTPHTFDTNSECRVTRPVLHVHAAASVPSFSLSYHDKWPIPGGELGAIGTAKTRSISYGDATSLVQLQKSPVPSRQHRVHSLPHSDHINETVGCTDLVDDAFSPHSFKNKLPVTCSSEYSKPLSRVPAGWLEVSIDSTLPSSPCLRKDVFDFSSMDSSLPSTSSTVSTSNDHQVVLSQNSSLLKKLLPDMPLHCHETYSRKVFIGGLPPDIDQEEICLVFQKYGSLVIDWPHKLHSKARVPPKGYAFLLFKEEASVHKLLVSCLSEGDKLFAYVKYYTSMCISKKKCQIRPWKIADGLYMSDPNVKVDPRKAVFVGGVPRPLKASELAEVMANKFGVVTLVAIDCDAELKYPKGAACVVFATHSSFIAAVSSRFMQLVFGSLEKKVELKPYILDDQQCDECHGIQSDGQPAPFFCGSVICLKYYCEHCWATFHSLPGRQSHRPMFKDIFDREKY